jgi:lipoprotein NlpI
MARFLLTIALGAICMVPVSGSAQARNDNWNSCNDNNPDLAIDGCTAVIQPGAEKGANLELAYRNRSRAYLGKGEYDKAIADCDAAIHLKPDDFLAFDNRGNAYLDKGEYEKAVADYDTVLRLKPDFVRAYNRRGFANLFAGKFAAAASDLEKGVAQAPSSAYNVVWLHVARVRGAQDDAQEFARNASKLDLKPWPGPVVALFQQQMSPEQVLAAAADSDAKTQVEHYCVADFFMGEKALLDGKTTDAQRMFVQARTICPANFLQAKGAQAELKQMGK